jgi:hypothetical protein
VAMAQGLFGNPGRGTYAVGSRYQRTDMGHQAERIQSVDTELQRDFN